MPVRHYSGALSLLVRTHPAPQRLCADGRQSRSSRLPSSGGKPPTPPSLMPLVSSLALVTSPVQALHSQIVAHCTRVSPGFGPGTLSRACVSALPLRARYHLHVDCISGRLFVVECTSCGCPVAWIRLEIKSALKSFYPLGALRTASLTPSELSMRAAPAHLHCKVLNERSANQFA